MAAAVASSAVAAGGFAMRGSAGPARPVRAASARATAAKSISAKSVVMGTPIVQKARVAAVCNAGAAPATVCGGRKGLAAFVERVNTPQLKDDLIPFRTGMTVKVGVTVTEGGKSRVQPFEGVVIGIHRAGVATTVTVRKSFQGYGVERIFPIHSPLCSFEEIRGAGKPVVRRSKLYYLRNRVGKQARLKTKFTAKKTGPTRHELKMQALKEKKEAVAAEAAAAEAAAAAAEAEAAAAEEGAGEEEAEAKEE